MTTKSTEERLQEVIDREEIRTLPVRYCDRVWQKDPDGYAKLFTEDGWFATNDPKLPRAEGRANLSKMIAEQAAAANPCLPVSCVQSRLIPCKNSLILFYSFSASFSAESGFVWRTLSGWKMGI